MKPIKFYIVLALAKMARVALKIIRRDATYFPGKLAVTLCPDFLGYIEKPKTIIGVTGTNGKTTVCNMISDIWDCKAINDIVYSIEGKHIQLFKQYSCAVVRKK